MKALVILALMAIPICSFGSIGILMEGPGFQWSPYSNFIPNRYDVEKDGVDEFVYMSSWNVVRAINESGAEVWSYTLDPSEVCPSCDTGDWIMEIHGFVDTEPGQRNALVIYRFYDSGIGYYLSFLGLVSTSGPTGTLVQTFPGRYFVACMDLGGDGLWELALAQTDGPPEGYWEIWGDGSITGVPDGTVPTSSLELMQNSPNPFNPTTKLNFTMHRASAARIEFFDSAGRMVDATDLGNLTPGSHEFTWRGRDRNGRSLPSGNYFYSIVSGSERQSRKMLLLK